VKTARREEMNRVKNILERAEADLVETLRKRDGITIEKSADQMDEVQYARERELAIGNVNRGSILLNQVRAALQRIHVGSFGACIECEQAINPKRLAAVPWAPRCIQCQEAVDQDVPERMDFISGTLLNNGEPAVPRQVNA
jgi:DnaK suppressor protein